MEQQRALAAQREEMSRYGKADMARSSAEGFAHKLLAEKARARLLAGRVAHGEARARQYERDGRRLKEQSKKEERDFEHMAGPVHKARAAVKLANNAYDAATMRLASAETAGASAPAGDAKVRAEAAAKVAEDRKLVRHMEGLVRGATERLARVEGKNGPLTGLDSHFEGPKRRAVRELAKARRVRDGLRRDRQREQVLREDVEGELPQLKRNMRRAKVLHKSYEEARERAIKAERSAGEAERALSSAQARLSGDEQRAQGLQTALRAAEQGVGRELESAYEGDWRSLAEMHQELINDKEQYSKARRLSCGAGGPCPKETGDGLPRRVHA
uniref:Uncharacterized protein n=1 Tax=Hemiselmis tepida TaxID=464990 RepID=A0A7S0Z6R5_9CRYP